MSASKEELQEAVEAAVKAALGKEAQKAESHVDHVCGCPDCYCGAIEKLNKTSEFVCDHCGLPLGNKAFAEKIETCPNCGGGKARKIKGR